MPGRREGAVLSSRLSHQLVLDTSSARADRLWRGVSQRLEREQRRVRISDAPSSVFADSVTLADVRAKLDAEHPPVYVSSVTYGRLIVFTPNGWQLQQVSCGTTTQSSSVEQACQVSYGGRPLEPWPPEH